MERRAVKKEDHPTDGLYAFAEPKSIWRMRCYGFHLHGAPPEKAWEATEMIREIMGDDYNIRVQHNDEHFPAMGRTIWLRRRIIWTCGEYVGDK